MIDSMYEIEERFEKIKDHKPKASKKLNELGDIIASAYRIDADRADEMWQYLVDLNIADDIANSKFYIAQVFNKLIDRLKPEEATDLITMTPERVRLMVLHGYDGGTLWKCMGTLLKGYLNMDASDNASVCIEYFYEKFGGIDSDDNNIIIVAKNAANICIDIIKNSENADAAEELLYNLGESENYAINGFVKLMKALNGIGEVDDYDELFEIVKEFKYSVEFYDLLWIARSEYDEEELQEKWIEYVEECDDSDIRSYGYMYEDEENYEISKLKFYVDLEKDANELLSYYFNRSTISDVEQGVMWAWIEEENWDSFAQYVSLSIMAVSEEFFERSEIYRFLKQFMDCCFYDDGFDRTDNYGRSYKELMKSRTEMFAECLSKISAICIGCESHENYHELLKEFLKKLNGNLDILNEFGFEETVDTRNAEERLKDYVHDFLESGKLVYDKKSTKYTLIQDALSDEIYVHSHRGANTYTCTVNINLSVSIESGKIEAVKNEEKRENPQLEQTYRLAKDDEIAEFYFQHFPSEYNKRQEMLTACIKKNDVNRAIELIDMMAETKGNPGYEEANGWGRQNMLTIKYLIQTFDYTKADRWDGKDITDEMRQVAKQLVYRMLPYLSVKAEEEIKEDLYRIDPEKDDIDEYIEQLLEDADVYTTFPKPRGKGGAPNINRMTDEFRNCFERLSQMGRLDVVAQIMLKFAAVKNVLKPVTFDRWVSFMARDLNNNDLVKVYHNNPEIFEAWLEMESLRDWDIRRVASYFGEGCTRAEFTSFRNMVISHKGMVEGLDDAFKATSENTETQTLFDGENAKIELDFLEVYGNNPISNVELHLLTTKKTKMLESVRIVSCTINGIYTDDIGSYSDFNDNGPSQGYSIYSQNSSDTVTIYSDFFEENEINNIDSIEMQLMLADEDGDAIENMSAIIIKHDIYSGEYKVIEKAESHGSLIESEEDDEDGGNNNISLSDLLGVLLSNNIETDDDENNEEAIVYRATSMDFEDITFWDKCGIRIDFCGLNFDDDELNIKFWDGNRSGQKIKLFVKDLTINGEYQTGFSCFHVLDDEEHAYASYSVTDDSEISYYSTEKIDLSVEIDDEHYEKLYETMHIHIECNPITESYEVIISNSEQKNYEEYDEEYNDYDDKRIYQDDDVIVDFCGVDFYSDHLELSIWLDNSRDEKTKLFIESLIVNGISIKKWDLVQEADDWECEFSEICIYGADDIDYDDIKTIEFTLEVNDEENQALGSTKTVNIKCDVSDERYSVRVDD